MTPCDGAARRSGRSARAYAYSIVTVPLLTAATDSFRPSPSGTGVLNVQVTANGDAAFRSAAVRPVAFAGVAAVSATATSDADLSGRR